jgi:hypothetical protein
MWFRLVYFLGGFIAGIIFARITLPDPRRRRLPQFDYEIGDIEQMDTVISAGELLGAIPLRLGCPSRFVIYSGQSAFVPDCAEFGQDAANNRLCVEAFDFAYRWAQQIECPGYCERRIEEIFRGWSCLWSNADQRFIASAAVELGVECYLTE